MADTKGRVRFFVNRGDEPPRFLSEKGKSEKVFTAHYERESTEK